MRRKNYTFRPKSVNWNENDASFLRLQEIFFPEQGRTADFVLFYRSPGSSHWHRFLNRRCRQLGMKNSIRRMCFDLCRTRRSDYNVSEKAIQCTSRKEIRASKSATSRLGISIIINDSTRCNHFFTFAYLRVYLTAKWLYSRCGMVLHKVVSFAERRRRWAHGTVWRLWRLTRPQRMFH